MKSTLKVAALTFAIAAAWPAADAQAAVAQHLFRSNSVNYCQAFTPGPSNTVRNRVVGAENVGTAAIAVACNFHSLTNGAASAAPPNRLEVWFANNNTSGTITVTCTLLTGYQGETAGYAVTKTTAAIDAGGTDQAFLAWTQADNPTAGATSLGNQFIGINCTLPQGGVINDTYLQWAQDNGI